MPAKIILPSEVQTALRHDFYTDLTMADVCSKHSLSYIVVRRYWRQWFSSELVKQRQRRLLAKSKLGDKNPMYGQCGDLHHNYKEYTYVQGYPCVVAPLWYTGKVDNGRVYEHILVKCERHGLTQLPTGRVVHHIDHDKTNNCPDNLLIMTVSQHMKYHAAARRGDIERATTILQRSRVQENSKWPPAQ